MNDTHRISALGADRTGFAFHVSQSGAFREIHQHDDIEVGVLEGGAASMIFGHRRYVRRSGSLGLIWAMIPHGAIEVTAGTPCSYSLHLPLAWVLQWQLPGYLLKRLLGGELIEDAVQQRPCSDLALMKHWNSLLKTKQPAATEIVLLEVQARLRRLALTLESAPPPKEQATPETALFERIVVEISRRYREPLQVGDVARAVGVSSSHAMYIFRKESGLTIKEYVQRWRISAAQRLLATTQDKMANVARESGFNSLARFHATFKRACGQTPRQYRQSLHVKSN